MSPITMRTGSSVSAAFDCFEVSYTIGKIFLEPKPSFMGMSPTSSSAVVSKGPSHRLGKCSPPRKQWA